MTRSSLKICTIRNIVGRRWSPKYDNLKEAIPGLWMILCQEVLSKSMHLLCKESKKCQGNSFLKFWYHIICTFLEIFWYKESKIWQKSNFYIVWNLESFTKWQTDINIKYFLSLFLNIINFFWLYFFKQSKFLF